MSVLFAWVQPYLSLLKYFVMGAFIVAFLAFHFVDKHNAVKASRIEYTIELNKAVEKEKDKRIKLEKELNEKHTIALKQKDDKIQSIDAELSVALKRLSNRPTRPISMPSPTTTTVVQSCTGRELYKEDGQFLAREAARAEKVIAERDYYYNQYENARKELEKHGNRQK